MITAIGSHKQFLMPIYLLLTLILPMQTLLQMLTRQIFINRKWEENIYQFLRNIQMEQILILQHESELGSDSNISKKWLELNKSQFRDWCSNCSCLLILQKHMRIEFDPFY